MNLEQKVGYAEQAIAAAIMGRDRIISQFGKQQELISKGGVDAYTLTDKEVERKARGYLSTATGIPVFGEEEGGDTQSKFLWVLDKIDGTPNFRSGIPLFGSSVSLLEGHECITTATYLPALGELYVATKGSGAYQLATPAKNEEEILDFALKTFRSEPARMRRLFCS